MESSNGIKDWVRRYSPLKSKNKPLPDAPGPEEPCTQDRAPMKPTSGNASPTKQKSSDKLRSLLRPKPSMPKLSLQQPESINSNPNTARRPGQSNARPHHRAVSLATETFINHDHNPARKIHSSPRTNDLYRLSQKVSDLEAQLSEARQEIQTITQTRTMRRSSLQHLKKASRSETEQDDRANALNERYNGLVESLLEQRAQVLNHSHTNINAGPTAWDEYRANMSSSADNGVSNFSGTKEREARQQARQHKRKRSELRQASWDKIQNHLASVQEEQQHTKTGEGKFDSGPRAKRSRSECISSSSKALPQVPGSPSPSVFNDPPSVPFEAAKTSRSVSASHAQEPPRTLTMQGPQYSSSSTPRPERRHRRASEGSRSSISVSAKGTIQAVAAIDETTTYDQAVAQLEAELGPADLNRPFSFPARANKAPPPPAKRQLSKQPTIASLRSHIQLVAPSTSGFDDDDDKENNGPHRPHSRNGDCDDTTEMIDLDAALDVSSKRVSTTADKGNYMVLQADDEDDDEGNAQQKQQHKRGPSGGSILMRSPSRRSPSRLERVPEEYEWDDDIF